MAYNDLTNALMANPWMLDPSQQSNQFSNYNNAALPWPPSYNPGLAGGPVNAATGKPIASFQQWQQQNPGGMSINATPAAPQAAPQLQTGWNPGYLIDSRTGLPSQNGSGDRVGMGTFNFDPNAVSHLAPTVGNQAMFGRGLGQPQAAPQAAQQAGGAGAPPNNWQAALNALANPGNPVTQGATVPQATGSQPAGGVNAAFLNQAGAGQGMNQNFLSALRAIQNR